MADCPALQAELFKTFNIKAEIHRYMNDFREGQPDRQALNIIFGRTVSAGLRAERDFKNCVSKTRNCEFK